jgi:SAM-dependent methyltransferase
VDLWHQRAAESGALIDRTGFPRNVLSRLLSVAKISVGSSALDVGCGGGELVAFFDSLGIRCVGIDESPQNVLEARKNAPHCDIHRASLRERFPGAQVDFDLVLVRQSSEFRRSMFSRQAFSATEGLFERIRPGGSLVFVVRPDSQQDAHTGHELSCFVRHLEALPGEHELHEVHDGTVFTHPLRSLISGRTGPGYGIVLLRMPRRLADADWAKAADAALEKNPSPCCPWAAQTSAARSKAA